MNNGYGGIVRGEGTPECGITAMFRSLESKKF